MRKVILILLLLNVLCAISVDAVEPFTVRVIYFKAQGAPSVNHAKYDRIIKDMQEFFRNEMIRHGYGDKTFRIETDNKGDLVIHEVNGRHPGEHYMGITFDTYYDKMIKEIPFEINNGLNKEAQDDIYIVIIGGVELPPGSPANHWGNAWVFQGEGLGGTGIVNENFEKLYPQHYTSIIYHEFGHTFHLEHSNFRNSLMGPLPFGGPKGMEDFEAQLLSELHFFNEDHVFNAPPEVVGDLSLKAIGKFIVRFELKVQGSVDLHHCQICQYPNYLGSVKLKGKNDVVQIDVDRHLLLDPPYTFDIVVVDSNGNIKRRAFSNLEIPEFELDNNELKYLTIRDKDRDSFVPTNNPIEWCGWENAGIFEKQPGRPRPQLPNWYIDVPKLNEWDSWFYSHAKARFVYDVSKGEYNRFEARFYLPNPCDGDGADVEVICLADDVEVYHSEILRAPAAQNKQIIVDFPSDTETFTIEVTDAKDGIRCDHFVLGNARVFISEPADTVDNVVENDVACIHCRLDIDEVTVEENLSVSPQHKLTTRWATIKARR